MTKRAWDGPHCWFAVLLLGATLAAAAADDVAGDERRSAAAQPVQVESLLSWRVLGGGAVSLADEPHTIRLSEGRGSRGVVLLSPDPLPDSVVVRFELKPEQVAAIPVVLISARPVAGAGSIEPGPDYDGSVDYWTGEHAPVQSYAIGFHTGFHQPYAFILKNPGGEKLAESMDIATQEQWYRVEIGRRAELVWLKIEDRPLLFAYDPEGGLPAGYLGLRLRGPGDGSAAILVRNLTIERLS